VCDSQCVLLASLEGAAFLSEVLSERVYVTLYEEMEREAAYRSDTVIRCRAFACLSYRHAVYGNVALALQTSERADGIARSQEDALDDTDLAFTLYCLGKAIWLHGADDSPERKKGI